MQSNSNSPVAHPSRRLRCAMAPQDEEVLLENLSLHPEERALARVTKGAGMSGVNDVKGNAA